MASHTYSFLDVQAAIAGPNGSFSLGNGAGPSEEGITVTMTEDKGTMTIGADGSGMHSLHAGKSGTVTVRLLRTSPVNEMLMSMYNAATSSGASYGGDTISIRNPIRGDNITCSNCGFRKAPDLNFAKDGGTVEWSWNAVAIDAIIGTGAPSKI